MLEKCLLLVKNPCLLSLVPFRLNLFIYSLGGPGNKVIQQNGPSEKADNLTISVQRTAYLPPIDFTIELIHFEPPRSGHLSTPNNRH